VGHEQVFAPLLLSTNSTYTSPKLYLTQVNNSLLLAVGRIKHHPSIDSCKYDGIGISPLSFGTSIHAI